MSSIPPFLRCPSCGSEDRMKNGTTRRGKQNYNCRDCGRQFVEKPQWQPRAQDSIVMMDCLLLEKISLAGIAHVLKLSASWLQGYVNRCYKAVPHQVQVLPKPKRPLTVHMDELWSFVDDKGNQQWVWLALDELWSFVDDKGNQQWVWLALDIEMREIMGCHIGDCSKDSALALWDRCQQCIGNAP